MLERWKIVAEGTRRSPGGQRAELVVQTFLHPKRRSVEGDEWNRRRAVSGKMLRPLNSMLPGVAHRRMIPSASNMSRLPLHTFATSPVSWILLSAVCVAVDYNSGPYIQFPIVYLVPVSLASWYSGRRWGLGLALTLPLFRLAFRTVWDPPWSFTESLINAAIRITTLSAFAWAMDRISRQMRELRHMQLLEGMLGVCGNCKRIRDERDGGWQPLDTYVARHPESFTRDRCPECEKEAGDFFDRR